MKKPLLVKFIAIGALMLLLLIPIGMINNSIDERQANHASVLQDIARSSSYRQTVVGPILVVPYKKKDRVWRKNEKNENYLHEVEHEGKLYFLPQTYRVNGNLVTELRTRGIYSARLYHAVADIDGEFALDANYGITEQLEDYQFLTPFMAMGISDIRGIENSLKLTMNDKKIDFEPGSQLTLLGDGVHAELNSMNSTQPGTFSFSLQLALQGTEHLNFSPIGKETHVELHSDWPHPSFVGEFLPVERSVTDQGFDARWQTSYFSTNFAEIFYRCVNDQDCGQYQSRLLGVSMIDPVDQYVKSDRAIKYALLFIALTFASFFLFEVLKRLAIHPIQYGLVGLALAFFYLLLLSLSEHIGFGSAYAVSALVCVALIGFYVSYVLKSVQRGAGFTLGLILLYGLLYGLLSAEDYALMLGSILLFSLLGVFMLLTRNVDWYAIGTAEMLGKKPQQK